jgi:hypothetical protein
MILFGQVTLPCHVLADTVLANHESLICSILQLLWCKFSLHGQCQATNVKPLEPMLVRLSLLLWQIPRKTTWSSCVSEVSIQGLLDLLLWAWGEHGYETHGRGCSPHGSQEAEREEREWECLPYPASFFLPFCSIWVPSLWDGVVHI